MNRVKVKTREKVQNIKALDKAAIAGERMKNAYIRSRKTAVRNRDDRNNTPTGYAEEQVQEAARRVARNTIRTARIGGKAIRQKEQKYSDKRNEPPPREQDTTASKEPLHKEIVPEGETPPQPRLDPLMQRRKYRCYFYRAKKNPVFKNSVEQVLLSHTPTPDLVTERGREFAKKQAAKRTREIKTKEILTAARQKGDLEDSLSKTAPKVAVKGPSRPVIKVARYDRAAFQAEQVVSVVSRKAAQAAERAEKIAIQTSRFAARSTAVVARKAAKVSAAAVKAVLASAQALIAAIAAGGGVAVLAVVVVICLVGQLVCSGFGIFFSNESSRGQTMASAVQEIDREFEDRLAAIQSSVDYDILDQSGSCAPWPDVLAVYAVKTTTDPDNGQEVVAMDDGKKALLRDVFWDMNSISHSVTVRTYEVSGTTTDENGNTVDTTETETEVTLHITIGHRTADEMADAYRFNTSQREQLKFLLLAENRSLWDAALRGIGGSVGGSSGGDIVSVALSQVGNVGGEPYWRWYGFDSRVEWCACFVSWCANESGVAIPKFSRCVDGVAWFKGQGLWQSGSYSPQPGDIIFFDWDTAAGQDGVPDHVGIVEKVEGGVVYTVEGNSVGDSCRRNRYAVGSSLICGYGSFSLSF